MPGALRLPNRPVFIPGDTMAWFGSLKPVASLWQDAQDWPAGFESEPSENIFLPSSALVSGVFGTGSVELHPATTTTENASITTAKRRCVFIFGIGYFTVRPHTRSNTIPYKD